MGLQDHLEHGYMYAAFVFVFSCVRTPRDGLIKEPNKFLHEGFWYPSTGRPGPRYAVVPCTGETVDNVQISIPKHISQSAPISLNFLKLLDFEIRLALQ